MKIVAISQARLESSRLPGKVMLKVASETLLEIHINRILKSKMISSFVLATTNKNGDDIIKQVALQNNCNFFRGSESDVLDRFYQASLDYLPDYIVRLTSDCPLIDPELIDEVINFAIEKDVDYCSNTLVANYPDGQDIEVIKYDAFVRAWKEAVKSSDREHVTSYIWENSNYKDKGIFSAINYCNVELNKYNLVRLTIDQVEDYEVIKRIISQLGVNKTWQDYADFYLNSIEIKNINNYIKRNEGYKAKNDSGF